VTSSSVPIHIFVQKYLQVQTFECRHVILMSSTSSRANLPGKQLVQLIQMPYICLCANISAITDGCNGVAQRKSLLQPQTVLFNPVRRLKHVFSVITVNTWYLQPALHTSTSACSLSDMRSAYSCRTAYSTDRRPTDIYGMTHR
jgi:hypothetical protein